MTFHVCGISASVVLVFIKKGRKLNNLWVIYIDCLAEFNFMFSICYQLNMFFALCMSPCVRDYMEKNELHTELWQNQSNKTMCCNQSNPIVVWTVVGIWSWKSLCFARYVGWVCCFVMLFRGDVDQSEIPFGQP